MRKTYVILGTLIALSMVLSACAPATSAPTAPPAAAATSAPAAAPTTAPAAAPAGEMNSKDPTTFTFATFGEPETLDPALDYETSGADVLLNVYDSLVFYKGENASEFVPNLATSWDISADGTTYTFHIREGVTFHNGDPMTPSDVAYSFQRGLLQGGTASPQWLLTEPFFGVGVYDVAEVVDPSGALDDDQAGLAASDPATLADVCQQVQSAIVADDSAGTVTMTLKQAWGPFLATIAQTWGSVMDQKWVAENGGWDGSCDTWQNFYGVTSENDPFTSIANGTGPFKFDHWTKGQEIVLTRNDNYWRTEPAWDGGPSGPAKLERAVIKYVTEFGTRFAMLQAGDADWIDYGSQADYAQLDPLVGEECVYDASTNSIAPCQSAGDGTGPLRVDKGFPVVQHTDVFFNFSISSDQYIGSGKLDGNGIPPDFFQDVHIRKAFNYCFDWDTFIKDVMVGEGVQTMTIGVAGMPGYDANAPHYTYDPDKCAEEFKASTLKSADGQSLWDTGFRFQATYNQGNTARQSVAEILAADLQAVNDKFSVETLGLPWPAFLQSQRAKTLPIFISGWLEDIHDPHNWYQPYLVGTYGLRQSLPEDLMAQYTDLLNQGVSESDPAKRDAIYKQINQIEYDNPSLILLATATGRHYEQRWVQGWFWNPLLYGFGPYFYSLSKQ
jgi:peptide/nickel transport system substrate-binding protein